MKHTRSTIFATLRLLTLAAACATTAVYADEYGDVSQLLRSGKLSEAMVKADAYLSSKPTDPQMRFLKGVIQRNSGKQAEAIATFTKLTEDYPELPEPYNNLAVLYAGQSQFDKARAALEMAIRTNPSYATAHENLGDVYARLASQAYNKALQLDGANAAVPPKLALIREVFKPNLKSQPSNLTAPASAPAAVIAKTPAPVPAPAAAPTPAIAPVTPVAPKVAAVKPATAAAPSAAPAKPAFSNNSVKEAEAAVLAWAKAWATQDMSAYLGAYGKEFDPPGKQSRSAWEQERRNRIVGKSSISVKLENLNVTVNGNKAVAKFRQDYRAGALSVSSRKTLELVKAGDRWLIVKEATGN
ncbi:MAG: tetratricopeptide repeat protein [Rhodoferax sp.]|uniref:nuclear transport factor 2 family protein n=1 Tax=Rhodoferax sp. TaxID=50421 RepID=UPI0018139450|nr:tetratricopeptide repeat protein [Rhodoferax sp.]NMM15248.1 tetratricopeptide repeat protein [Rhodoferax sp.]NMM19733.1 tetratricopeptide repeat protein [Rhodoferax sp.]